MNSSPSEVVNGPCKGYVRFRIPKGEAFGGKSRLRPCDGLAIEDGLCKACAAHARRSFSASSCRKVRA